jgi:hypothetical protein
MEDLRQIHNLEYLAKHVHGPFDRAKWGVYIPSFTFNLDNINVVSPTMEIHQFKIHDVEVIPARCHDPLSEAITNANQARKVTRIYYAFVFLTIGTTIDYPHLHVHGVSQEEQSFFHGSTICIYVLDSRSLQHYSLPNFPSPSDPLAAQLRRRLRTQLGK